MNRFRDVPSPLRTVPAPRPGVRRIAAQPAPPVLEQQVRRRGGHGWLMIACCIPMLVIGVVLVATGVVGGSFLFLAIGCTVMMATMMRAMNHDGMNHHGMTHSSDRSVHHRVPPPPPRWPADR